MYLLLEPKTLKFILKIALKKLEKLNFDSIAYTGTSGALFAIPLALRLRKNLVVVRKPNEQSHGNTIEYLNSCKRCLVVDDFVDTGATIERLIGVLTKQQIKIAAILLYNSGAASKKFNNIKIIRC